MSASVDAYAAHAGAGAAVVDIELLERQAGQRLEMMLAEREEVAHTGNKCRTDEEEAQALTMRRPLTPQQAYGLLGLCLGIFPPMALFANAYPVRPKDAVLVGILILMNGICAVVGAGMGRAFGEPAVQLERSSWGKMIGGQILIALAWAGITGFAGGAIALIVGGFVGAVLAAPVALAAFLSFSVMHRSLERGTLIELKHALPLALGISWTISAFIIGTR